MSILHTFKIEMFRGAMNAAVEAYESKNRVLIDAHLRRAITKWIKVCRANAQKKISSDDYSDWRQLASAMEKGLREAGDDQLANVAEHLWALLTNTQFDTWFER